MCPEPDLLSAWVDGEVPSPWSERLASHLESCPACAARVALYGRVSGLLAETTVGDDADIAAIVARVEARLDASLSFHTTPLASTSSQASPASPTPGAVVASVPALGRRAETLLWRRRIALPMPIAAAAVALLVFFAGIAASSFIRPARPAVQALAASEIAPTNSRSSNMEALVHYLESQNAQVNLTIQLPTGATFDASGKPFVVKATDADYAPFSATTPGAAGSNR